MGQPVANRQIQKSVGYIKQQTLSDLRVFHPRRYLKLEVLLNGYIKQQVFKSDLRDVIGVGGAAARAHTAGRWKLHRCGSRRCLCKRPQQTTVAGNTRRFHVVRRLHPSGPASEGTPSTAEAAAAVRP